MNFKLTISILLTCIITIISIPVKVSGEMIDRDIFDKLAIDEGLSNEHVTSIFQDSKGYIWIGTKDGLNRFDGERIKIYNCNRDDQKSLSSQYINVIEEDCSGNIWIGTDNGLDVLIRDTDNVIRVKDIDETGTHLGDIKITALLRSSTEEDIMWVGTENGLMKLNVKNSRIERVYNSKDDNNLLTNSYITYLWEEKDAEILYVGTAYGINIIDSNSNVIYKALEFGGKKLYVYDIEKDIYNNIWIVTKESIIVITSNEDEQEFAWIVDYDKIKKCNIYTGEVYSVIDNSGIINVRNAQCILRDGNGGLWISSTDGIIKYYRDTNYIEIIKKDNSNSNSLISNYVTCFYEDYNGTMWIGTEKGISILNRNKHFSSISGMLDEEENLNDDNIISILENNNELWIATKFNGIYVYDIIKGNLINKIYENDNLSLSNSYIKNLFKINDKYIGVVTNKDIILINVMEHKLSKKISDNEYSYEIKYSYNDGENLWIASTEGVYTYNIDENKLTLNNENLIKYNINPTSITYILADNNDSDIIWLGGVNTGVIKYHKENGVIQQYINSDSYKNSLMSSYINCMIFDTYGDLWIGTNVGLSKLDVKSNKFTFYTVEEGLTNDFINSILIDDNDNLWISTNKGLNRFNIKDENIINFTKMDGIIGYQFCLNSSIKFDNGNMIFGSTNGIAYFNPDNIIDTKMKVDEVVIGDVSVGKDKVVYDGKELVLDYNNKDLYIEFFLPNYENLNNITYQYIIEGIDKEWIYIDSRSHLDIKFLDPGKYTLKLRARDGHGDLTKETTMNIRVKNPIWRTPIAYILYIGTSLILIIYIVNYVNILRKLVEQKTVNLNKQLEENKKLSEEIINKEKFKNSYFVNLSHELRTPINVISSTVQLINSLNREDSMTKDRAIKYMNIISKSCNNLLKIINDIIDSSKIETGHYKITKKDNDIVYIVEEAALNMSRFIEEKGLSLIVDPDMEEKIISCDENEIERCIINLLGNAVKFTPEGGEIRVYIKEIDNYIEIIVEDTGIGISKEDQEFIFERFSQVEGNGVTKVSSSGIGLTLVKYIAKLHDGYVKLESEPNKGSRFIVGLPDITVKQ